MACLSNLWIIQGCDSDGTMGGNTSTLSRNSTRAIATAMEEGRRCPKLHVQLCKSEAQRWKEVGNQHLQANI
jgi:hypothetical protein